MGSRSNTSSLMVRLDEDSKAFIAEAAKLRRVSISDYVRMVTVSQARREVEDAARNAIVLTPEEQLEFWHALSQPASPTKAQRDLGSIARGES